MVVLGIMLCLTFSIAASPAYASPGAGTVTASALNLRSEPSTDSTVITCVPKGTVVLVAGSSDGWYKVWYQGNEGYMSADYLSFTYSAKETFGTGTVKGTGVRVRSGPSTGYSILGAVNTGKTLTVTGVSGNWYRVDYNGSIGYVCADYITVSYGGGSTSKTSAPPVTTDSSVKGTGIITGDYVRMRSGPSTSYSILGSYNTGTKMTVTGASGDWYAVTYNGMKGYVYKQYLHMTDGTSPVTAMDDTAAKTTAAVNMRSGPSTGYTSQRVLSAGTSVTITGKTGDWYRVSYNGSTGYIYKTYLTTGGSSAAGAKIVEEAKKYQGVRYVYGGASPSGFDCSGFVYYVYGQCGYSITRTATDQNSVGSYVSRSDLAPGDIIIFYDSAIRSIGHAGIYIGDNQFIHASSGSGKIIISSLSESYYNARYYSARRVA